MTRPNTKKPSRSAPVLVPVFDLEDSGLPPFLDILFPSVGPKHEPLVDDVLIRHPDFDEIMQALEELDDLDRAVLNEHCMLFTGESRLGKTRLLAEFIARRMPRRTAEGLEMEVIYLVIPERPTIRAVASGLLREFGEKPSKRDSADDMLDTIVALAAGCGVRIVCLDDFHHFFDQRGMSAQYELTEWLKRLVDKMRVALVITGLSRAELAVRLNEQLYARMDCRMVIRRFDWRRKADKLAFEKISNGMFGSVAKEFALPKEARDPFRVYIACSGKIGYLIKLYRRVIKIARRAGVKKVSLDMLDRAWRRTEFDPSRLDDSLQPFSRSFAAVPDKATIEHIVQSGVETGPKQDVGGRSKRAKRADVRNALAA